MTKMFKMNVLLMILPLMMSACVICDDSDPEQQLCQVLSADAAIYADDGVGYILKDQSYWELNILTGISTAPGHWISERWPGLPTPVDAAFTIDDQKYGLSSVFIKGNQWFLYNGIQLQANGSTTKWPQFPQKYPIMAAFNYYNPSIPTRDQQMFFIYNDDQFSIYQFHDIQKPVYNMSNSAFRIGNFFYFLGDPTTSYTDTIKYYLNVKAVAFGPNNFTFIGESDLCIGKTPEQNPLCNKIGQTADQQYFKCPRTAVRPTTTTTITTTSTTTTTNTSVANAAAANAVTTPLATETVSISSQSNDSTIAPDLPQMKRSRGGDTRTNWTLFVVLLVIVGIICLIAGIAIIYGLKHKKKSGKTDPKKSTKAKDKQIKEGSIDKTNKTVAPVVAIAAVKEPSDKASKESLKRPSNEEVEEADQVMQKIKSKSDDQYD